MVDVQGREITINRPEVAQDNDGTHREPDATVIEAGSTVRKRGGMEREGWAARWMEGGFTTRWSPGD